jgi:hypothetical protein
LIIEIKKSYNDKDMDRSEVYETNLSYEPSFERSYIDDDDLLFIVYSMWHKPL